MIKDSEVEKLQEIYREMDTDGKKKMLIAATVLLNAQNSLFNRKSGIGVHHFASIPVYIMAALFLISTVYVFWINLIYPALSMTGTPLVMVRIVITALIGMFCLGSGFIGFLFRKMSVPCRLLMILAGLGCLDPAVLTDFIGFAIIALVIAVQVIKGKREKTVIFAR